MLAGRVTSDVNESNPDEVQEKDEKPSVKICHAAKKRIKKTKLEKSIEMLSEGFQASIEKETDMFMKLERMRHREMLEHEIRLKELDNERRREERQHELLLLNLLGQTRNPLPPQREVNVHPSLMYVDTGAGHGRHYAQSHGSSSTSDESNYFEL